LSPNETLKSVRKELVDYFESGTLLARVVVPKSKSIRVFHGPDSSTLLASEDMLRGDGVLKRFAIRVGAVFEGI
jgi:hypothetical protein